jgi:hypothetical protein
MAAPAREEHAPLARVFLQAAGAVHPGAAGSTMRCHSPTGPPRQRGPARTCCAAALTALAPALGRHGIPAAIAGMLQAAWEQLLAPDWSRLRAILERDVVHRAGLLATDGWARAFDSLAVNLRWKADGRINPRPHRALLPHPGSPADPGPERLWR